MNALNLPLCDTDLKSLLVHLPASEEELYDKESENQSSGKEKTVVGEAAQVGERRPSRNDQVTGDRHLQ